MRTISLILISYGCALYGFVSPSFGLLFFVAITIFRPDNLVWGNRVLGRLHLITSLIVLIAYFIRRGDSHSASQGRYQIKNVFIFFILLVWLVVVSASAEASSLTSFDRTLEVAKLFCICFLFSKLVNTPDRINLYVWVSVTSLGLLSLWGFEQGLRGNPRLDTLTVGGSNFLAAQIVLLAPLALAKVFETGLSVRSRLVFFACTVSLVLCNVYSDSRGGFLGLAIGLLIFILQTNQRLKAIAILALLIALVSPWIPDLYQDRMRSIFVDPAVRDLSAAVRPVLWSIAIRIWRDHPILGVGLDNFSSVKDSYFEKLGDIVTSDAMAEHVFNQPRYTHGLYPGMLAETGLVGLGLFLALLCRNAFTRFPVFFTRSGSQHGLYCQGKAAQAGLIGFSVAAVFGDFQYIELAFWQMFLVGAIRDYADSLGNSGSDVAMIRSESPSSGDAAVTRAVVGPLGPVRVR
jgi:probable O-glycosylation ligase (exosortase A-associated)